MLEPELPLIDRETFLSTWPRSKAGNEWIRIDGMTYTIKDITFTYEHYKLVIVSRSGARKEYEAIEPQGIDYLKEKCWPVDSEKPLAFEELP